MQLTLQEAQPARALRRELHQYPDLSGKEENTAKRIVRFLQKYAPDIILEGVGGTGVIAVYNGANPEAGPTILFRSELDALPIQESNNSDYKSVNSGVSHKCGHDGHMAILVGLATLLHERSFDRGKVILLFQPAEETGEGAKAVLEDRRFVELAPDFVFALHNLPGYSLNQVVIRQHAFAAASTGMVVEFFGKPSHAAEPENGVNPGLAMAELIVAFNEIGANKVQFSNLTLLTIIHARLGEIAFGTNPGYATVMATLRSYLPQDMQLLKQLTESSVQRVAEKYGLGYSIHYVEEFPATINHNKAVASVQEAANKLGLSIHQADQPFRWSEDFGHFTNKYNGALFGLGAGINHAQLHHADYDFPDELIATGANLFYEIATELTKQ